MMQKCIPETDIALLLGSHNGPSSNCILEDRVSRGEKSIMPD